MDQGVLVKVTTTPLNPLLPTALLRRKEEESPQRVRPSEPPRLVSHQGGHYQHKLSLLAVLEATGPALPE